MKKFCTIAALLMISSMMSAQVTTLKADGGPVITKMGLGLSINPGSSVTRQFYIINDENCPLALSNIVGIKTGYTNTGFYFYQSGMIVPSDSVTAFEIHHVLYNVFGDYMKTLVSVNVTDLLIAAELSKNTNTWYADENEVTQYLTCVSYIASVRTKSGKVWKYDPGSLVQELEKLSLVIPDGNN